MPGFQRVLSMRKIRLFTIKEGLSVSKSVNGTAWTFYKFFIFAQPKWHQPLFIPFTVFCVFFCKVYLGTIVTSMLLATQSSTWFLWIIEKLTTVRLQIKEKLL